MCAIKIVNDKKEATFLGSFFFLWSYLIYFLVNDIFD